MAYPVKSAKIICDPLWGIIDVTEYLPMIDVPAFQALGFKYQLGVTSLLFPSATHTRKQHSFGAFKRTQDLADRWLYHGFINKNEAKLMIAYALWHDIGHGPFSHVVEEVTRAIFGRDHDQNGALIIDNLKDAVHAVGIDFAEFKKMFTHENPLYRAVHDKNLGTEKLDYLSRDAYFTLGEIPRVEYLAHHIYYIDNELVIDEKAIDEAKGIQEFYVKMYKNVYLRKNSAIAQRLVQKMVAELLRSNPIPEEEFWGLTDFGLLGHLETSRDPAVRGYYRHFMERTLPKTAIAFHPMEFIPIDVKDGKHQTSIGIPEAHMRTLAANEVLTNPAGLEKIERDIEQMAGLPERSVVVVPPTSLQRFVPQDIKIYASGGKTANLSSYFSNHFHAIEEEGKSYIVMRICTFAEFRKKLSEPAVSQKVKDYILALG